jgi:hypothetical protein
MKNWLKEHKEQIKKVSDILFYISLGIFIVLIVLVLFGVVK